MICENCGGLNSPENKRCNSCGVFVDSSTKIERQIDALELPTVSFVKAIRLAFRKYFSFDGRSRRSEYWWFYLFTQLIGLASWMVNELAVISLILLIPLYSVTARRLHDIGKTGWWQLIFPIGGIGCFYGLTNLSSVFLFQPVQSDKIGDSLLADLGALLGGIVILGLWIYWTVAKGDKGPNKYGPDPRLPGSMDY